MKKRLLAVLTALSLLLTGCASLLEQEYVDVTPHNAIPTAEGDPSTLRAENYQELVNALLYLVTSGKESGKVRLYLNSEDIDADLEAACLEVVQEDPLAAYCVDYIKYSVQPVVTYADADVQIVYRRTQEQIASISAVTGVTAIRSELVEALNTSATELVLRISYFDGDEQFIHTLCRQAYYANPASALDLPDIAVSIYPDSGRQRIIEMALTYHLEPTELENQRAALQHAISLFLMNLTPEEGETRLAALIRVLSEQCAYDPEGGSTAYHALLAHSANSEGMALAMAALCNELDIPCRIVSGTRDNVHHVWNLISRDEGWYHLDLTQLQTESPDGEEPLALFRTDLELTEAGYVWDTQFFPQSVSLQPPAEADSPAESALPE